jgi:hypothetical protein
MPPKKDAKGGKGGAKGADKTGDGADKGMNFHSVEKKIFLIRCKSVSRPSQTFQPAKKRKVAHR